MNKFLSISLVIASSLQAQAQAKCTSWEAYPKGVAEAKMNHSLYREHFKNKKYDEAFKYWEPLFAHVTSPKEAPTRHFEDGAVMYSKLAEVITDSVKKVGLLTKLTELYANYDACVGGLNSNTLAYKGYYLQSAGAPSTDVYAAYKTALDKGGDKTMSFILAQLAYQSASLFSTKKVSADETRTIFKNLITICNKNIATNEKEKANYTDILKQVNQYLGGIETQVMDYPYFVEKFTPAYTADPKNPQVYKPMLAVLKQVNCPADVEIYKSMLASNAEEQSKLAAQQAAERQAQQAVQKVVEHTSAPTNNTPEGLKQRLQTENDPKVIADINMSLADVYYRQKQFSTARSYAQAAAKARPGWGKPYILIGLMYASSGDQCNPGGNTGWESQVVVWAAVDMWQRAKSVDGDVASEANRYIGQYSKFMPSKEDCFQRGVKVGSSFRVPCWIQESTTVRTAN
jgi:hypothetical protein